MGRRPTERQQTDRRPSPWLWTLFFACAFTTIALFFIPAFIIRPFRHQAPRALFLAMALRQRAPQGTLIAGVTCFFFAFALWRAASRWRKTVIAFTMLLVAFSAVIARLNYFEWMFHPIAGAGFLAQSESKLIQKK